MPDDVVEFVGGNASDPVFAAINEVVGASLGELVETYARALTTEQVQEFHDRLDAVEPAHANASARLHTLFAG